MSTTRPAAPPWRGAGPPMSVPQRRAVVAAYQRHGAQNLGAWWPMVHLTGPGQAPGTVRLVHLTRRQAAWLLRLLPDDPRLGHGRYAPQ